MVGRTYQWYTMILSLIFIIIIFSYYSATPVDDPELDKAIGGRLVASEFPSPEVSPIYFKPATYLVLLVIAFWYSLMDLTKKWILSKQRGVYFFRLALLLIAILALYEVLFNFILWDSLLGLQEPSEFNPDKVTNVYPSEKYPVNLVFATKVGITILGCSVYGLVILWERK